MTVIRRREWCFPRDARCRPQVWGIYLMFITLDTKRFKLPWVDTKNYLTWFFMSFQFAWWVFSAKIQNPKYEHRTGSSWGENCELDDYRRAEELERRMRQAERARGY